MQPPPGPKGLPVLGHLLDLRRDILGFFTHCARRYGDVVGARVGPRPAVLLSDPADIEHVLVRHAAGFRKPRLFWGQVRAIFGNGLLTSEGAFWLRQRRLAAPAFAGQRLAGYGGEMVRHTQRMLDGWQPGVARDLHADMMALTLRIAAKTLFGAEVEEDMAAIDEAVTLLTHEIAVRFSRPFVIPDSLPLPGHIRYRRGLRAIERLVGRILAERRARLDRADDLLSTLMLARDEHGAPMSDRQLRDEAVTLLLAGHETTALALSWTGYLLGRHPEVQDALAAEVRAVLGDRAAAVADLPQLRLADRVVTEAMRLYPPAWAIGREAVDDCAFGGYAVRAGTTIYMSPWVIHRDPRHYEDPDAFRPERWSGDLARRLPRFAYLPFSGGPRVCIGSRFAMMEAVLILATLVQRFSLDWRRDRPVVPFASITLRPHGGVWVTPSAR